MTKIPTLTQIYNANIDVRESYIPEKWKDSFNKFIFGSTCYKSGDEFIYYSHDFRRWYHMNEAAIVRDEKINTIISNENTI